MADTEPVNKSGLTDAELREKYELSEECPLTIDHALQHLDGARVIVTEEDGVTPIAPDANQDTGQQLHELLSVLQILRVVKEREGID